MIIISATGQSEAQKSTISSYFCLPILLTARRDGMTPRRDAMPSRRDFMPSRRDASLTSLFSESYKGVPIGRNPTNLFKSVKSLILFFVRFEQICKISAPNEPLILKVPSSNIHAHSC